MGSTSDSDEALDILVDGVVNGSHYPSHGQSSRTTQNAHFKLLVVLIESKGRRSYRQIKKDQVWTPKNDGEKKDEKSR